MQYFTHMYIKSLPITLMWVEEIQHIWVNVHQLKWRNLWIVEIFDKRWRKWHITLTVSKKINSARIVYYTIRAVVYILWLGRSDLACILVKATHVFCYGHSLFAMAASLAVWMGCLPRFSWYSSEYDWYSIRSRWNVNRRKV